MKEYCPQIGRNCGFLSQCSRWNESKKHNCLENRWIDHSLNALYLLGLKKVIKFEHIPSDQILKFKNQTIKQFPKAHFAYYSNLNEQSINEAWMAFGTSNIVFGRDKKDIHDYMFFDLFRDGSENLSQRILYTWKLLWYPSCCVSYAVDHCRTMDGLQEFGQWHKVAVGWVFPCPLLPPKEWNPLHVHYPCSNVCIKTIEINERVLSFLCQRYGATFKDVYFTEAWRDRP